MTKAMKARAVYRALETARGRGMLGLNKAALYSWCKASHSMTQGQVDAGLEALMDGEMLNYAKTVVMDWRTFCYRVVDVGSLPERMVFQRDVDRRTRYAITHAKRTSVKVVSMMDDAVRQNDIKRAMHLSQIKQRSDDLLHEAQNLEVLVAAL